MRDQSNDPNSACRPPGTNCSLADGCAASSRVTPPDIRFLSQVRRGEADSAARGRTMRECCRIWASRAGDHGSAMRLLEESMATGRESGDLVPVVYSTIILGHMLAGEGNTARAREMVDGALAIARRIDARDLMPHLLVLLGDVATREADWEAADDLYGKALRLSSAAASRGR